MWFNRHLRSRYIFQGAFIHFPTFYFLTMTDRISIVEMVFQIKDVSYLRIVLRSLRSANQHDLLLVMDIEHGMLWS